MKCVKKVVRTLLVAAVLFTAMPQITVEAKSDVRVSEATPVTAEGGLQGFVTRLYVKVLDRNPEKAGLNYWMDQISTGKQTVLNVSTNGFFHSNEYLNKHTSNDQFVKTLYRTFLDREAEKSGYNYWMKKLNAGVDRDEIIYGFAYSKEFAGIMATFGVGGNSTTTSAATTTTTTTVAKATTSTTTTTTTATAANTTVKEGTAGLLTIPSVGVTVPLYKSNNSNEYQTIVDAENSALFTTFMGKKMIADHAHQGFKKMRNATKGTVAYIQQGSTRRNLVCTAKYTNGVNMGNGIKIGNQYADQMKDGDLFMYTCNDSEGVSVTVTFWNFQ